MQEMHTCQAPFMGKIDFTEEFFSQTADFRREQYITLKNSDLSPACRSVYKALLAYAKDQTYVWPSLTTLMEETGYTKPTILKCLNTLKEEGFIAVSKMQKRNGMGNMYELCPRKIQAIGSAIFDSENPPEPLDGKEDFSGSTGKATLPVLVKPLYPNKNIYINKKQQLGELSSFLEKDKIPDSWLTEAKKELNLDPDNSTYDSKINDVFMIFKDYMRHKDYSDPLPYWRRWVGREISLIKEIQRNKRKSASRPPRTCAVTPPSAPLVAEVEPVLIPTPEDIPVMAVEGADIHTPEELHDEIAESLEKEATRTEKKVYKTRWVDFWIEHKQRQSRENTGQEPIGTTEKIINFAIRHYDLLIFSHVEDVTDAGKKLLNRITHERRKLSKATVCLRIPEG